MLDSWAPRGTLRPGVLVEPALGRDWKEEARRRGLEFLLPVYPALRRVWHRDGHLCGGAPFLHLSQTPRPLGLLLRLRARWEPRCRRAGPGRGAGGALGRGSKWSGGSRGCAVALLPRLSLSHGHRSLFCPPHVLPISVFLLGGSRLSGLIPVRSYFQLSSLEPCGAAAGLPALPARRPQLPPSGKPGLNRPQGLQRVRKEILRSLRWCDFPPILSSRPNPTTVGLS